ncbi:hypothetical protein AAZU54_05775 [Pseudomonas sp. Je.1.5.c]
MLFDDPFKVVYLCRRSVEGKRQCRVCGLQSQRRTACIYASVVIIERDRKAVLPVVAQARKVSAGSKGLVRRK